MNPVRRKGIRLAAMTVSAALRFGTHGVRDRSAKQIEFYRLKVPNEREFLSGVSIEVTSDLRDISILTDLRDQRCFIDWN